MRYWRGLWVTLFIVCLGAAGLGWALASPVGGSPDDDYHLTSIWCPRPVEKSCGTENEFGSIVVNVPEKIADSADCLAFHAELSAECTMTFSDDKTDVSYRYDAGNYPVGYYHFQHLFVSHNVVASVVFMRVVNVLIALGLIVAIGALAPPLLRPAMAAALMAAWVPMGLYFIASNNPTSWAITGTFAYASAMFAAAQARGWRRYVLLVLGALGALVCFASRYDASLYIFVISVALFFAIKWQRRLYPQAIVVAVLGIIGIAEMLYGFAAGPREATGAAITSTSLAYNLITVILRLPGIFAGFYGGYGFGPGWVDVPFDDALVAIPILIAGGIIFLGIRGKNWRKLCTAIVVAGAMVGLLLVYAVAGLFPELSGYQPRYELPLLGVLFFFLLAVDGEKQKPVKRHQAIFMALGVFFTAALALHRILERYVVGISKKMTLNLDQHLHWWWNIAISPMWVWGLACVAFALALAIGIYLAKFPPADIAGNKHKCLPKTVPTDSSTTLETTDMENSTLAVSSVQ